MGEYEVGMISTKNVVSGGVIGTGGGVLLPQAKLGYAGDPSLMPRNMKMTSVNEENLDPTILDKVRALNSAKTKAVEQDDFDKAKNLKEVIDKLKVAGH